ncbi:putative alpha-glucan water dikinase 1 [Besnoitia besnoiti]|uniref:Putative alpha-glucan water dikinase 1 n=1 Tax=Besnoitia besnoiti TaxID=94643 RepID=A0A2A9MGK9_BESBE|nr:putative alpha-glucan water dikinase 1 [Besnoitia besnoiti]PFH37115.1 putative alpha-glucan water dikinase 1 [Besnoitia besnoiti]
MGAEHTGADPADSAALAFAPLRAKAEEATATYYLEGNRQLKCTVRKQPPAPGKTEGTVEVIFAFQGPVFNPNDQKQLFMHWGVGNNPHEWNGLSPELQSGMHSSSETQFPWGAAKTTFPSPSSSPPPVVVLAFPESLVPAYMCFLFHTQWNEWIRQQGGSNLVLAVQQLVQQVDQQKGFLDTILASKTTPAQNGKTTLPIASDNVQYWKVPLGAGVDMQLVALTYHNAMAAAVELFSDFPAALTLYWSGANGPHDSWQAPPPDSLLGQPGVVETEDEDSTDSFLPPRPSGRTAQKRRQRCRPRSTANACKRKKSKNRKLRLPLEDSPATPKTERATGRSSRYTKQC